MSDITYIYGKNAIIEALEVQERTFNKILIADNLHKDEKIEQIKAMAKSNGVIFQFVKKEKLDILTEKANHQGVVALISPIKYCDLENFIDKNREDYNSSLIVLDGVEDPHNLGAIIRTAVCAGIKGIMIPSRRGALVNSIVEKTSAGAINHISIVKVNSLVNAIQRLKDENYWVIASDHHAKDNCYDINYTDMKFVLIMGAEHSGISKSLLKLSDYTVKIPMLTDFNSLNVSNATAVLLFEYVRQKITNKRG